MKRTDYCRIIREIENALDDYSMNCEVEYQRPMGDEAGLFMITIEDDDWDWDGVNDTLRDVMDEEELDWGDQEADEDVTLVARWD